MNLDAGEAVIQRINTDRACLEYLRPNRCDWTTLRAEAGEWPDSEAAAIAERHPHSIAAPIGQPRHIQPASQFQLHLHYAAQN